MLQLLESMVSSGARPLRSLGLGGFLYGLPSTQASHRQRPVLQLVRDARSMLPAPCKAATAAQEGTRHPAGHGRHAVFDAFKNVLICLLVYIGHQAPHVQHMHPSLGITK